MDLDSEMASGVKQLLPDGWPACDSQEPTVREQN